jgi:hypothetical protein
LVVEFIAVTGTAQDGGRVGGGPNRGPQRVPQMTRPVLRVSAALTPGAPVVTTNNSGAERPALGCTGSAGERGGVPIIDAAVLLRPAALPFIVRGPSCRPCCGTGPNLMSTIMVTPIARRTAAGSRGYYLKPFFP